MSLSRNATKRPSDEITIQEETFPAAEKILSDIENVLKKDLELKSFEIIPIDDNENKSPVYHEEHSLGLASWCVQPLYCYAYGRLLRVRRSEHRREESTTISRWLMGALLLNPNVSSFWNMRRELVRAGRLDAFEEFRFAAIVLHLKAKCFEAFAYRRWLLGYLLTGGKTSQDQVENLLTNEIRLAGISADRYANNYHAWSHREHAVHTYEKQFPERYEFLLRSEWQTTGKWCSRHVSEHSGLAYRQSLLNRLIYDKGRSPSVVPSDELAERRRLVRNLLRSFHSRNDASESNEETEEPSRSSSDEDSWQLLNLAHGEAPKIEGVDYDRELVALSYWTEEYKNNENDILTYPGHEALWYHRRFLRHVLACLDDSYRKYSRYESTNPVESSEGSSHDDRSRGLLALVFQRDNETIRSISLDSNDQPQTTLSEKFIKYWKKFGYDVSTRETR